MTSDENPSSPPPTSPPPPPPPTDADADTGADADAGQDADADAVIVARGLRRTFGDEVALDGLDLRVTRGSIYGFVGPSGSGKTTAVRLLTAIDAPTDGEVEVLGRATRDFDQDLRRRIGYLPQSSVQFPNLSVRQNLSFAASLYGLPLRRRQVIDDLLERTELAGHEKKSVKELSGGMQRRLALAAALVHDPEVMFLDEPTAGIDPVLRRKLWDFFEELRDQGRTLFVTTQYVGEAAYCDRVGVLSSGRLVADDTPQGLRRRALGGDVLELTPSLPFDEPTMAALREHDGVRQVQPVDGNVLRLVVDVAERRLPQLQDWCTSRDLEVESLREDQVPFDDIFAALMRREREHDDQEATVR
jgi:ABC-2 type transport system ATP-binding protein